MAQALLNLKFLAACYRKKPDKGLNPDKPEITNYKRHLILNWAK